MNKKETAGSKIVPSHEPVIVEDPGKVANVRKIVAGKRPGMKDFAVQIDLLELLPPSESLGKQYI